MSTVSEPVDTGSTFSGDAIDLLDCFSSGFDDVLSSVAESLATSRTPDGRPVEITSEDIVTAAKRLMEAIKESQLPKEVRSEIDSMMDCMSRQLRKEQ